MSIRRIRLYGDPVLAGPTKPVQSYFDVPGHVYRDMVDTLDNSKSGVGLAANQIGFSQQIILLKTGGNYLFLLNPKIISEEGNVSADEQCLSLPGVTVNMARADKITVEFLNAFDNIRQVEFSGLEARILQHEIDHLNGKLLVDAIDAEDRMKIKPLLDKMSKKNRP